MCHVVQRDSSATSFWLSLNHIYFSFILLADTIHQWRRGGNRSTQTKPLTMRLRKSHILKAPPSPHHHTHRQNNSPQFCVAVNPSCGPHSHAGWHRHQCGCCRTHGMGCSRPLYWGCPQNMGGTSHTADPEMEAPQHWLPEEQRGGENMWLTFHLLRSGTIYVHQDQYGKDDLEGTADRCGKACMDLPERYNAILSTDWKLAVGYSVIGALHFINQNGNPNATERERERDRQTDRQTETERDRDRDRERQRERERERHTHTHIYTYITKTRSKKYLG